MSSLKPFNLQAWINENRQHLKPPVGNKSMWNGQFLVMIVGGPNARTDYHINQTEEFFFQLKGTVKVRIQHEGKPHDVVLPEGSIYLLPANTPHAPMRGPDTAG